MCPALRSMPEEAPPAGGEELGALLLGEAEAYDWGAVANLDAFFTRIYRWVGTCGVRWLEQGGAGRFASPPAVEGGHASGACGRAACGGNRQSNSPRCILLHCLYPSSGRALWAGRGR